MPLVPSSGMFCTQHGQLSGSSMEATAVGDLGDDVAYGCYPLWAPGASLGLLALALAGSFKSGSVRGTVECEVWL